jgi:hypothetical protein
VRQSTKLGNILGTAMRGSAHALDYMLPLAAISAYRLIPDQVRGRLFGGPSTSLFAVRMIREGQPGWYVIRMAASNHPPRPS